MTRCVLFLSLMALSSVALADQRLPEWFDDARVQAHLAMGSVRNGSELNYRTVDLVSELGTYVFTRHVKTDWRPPAWESPLDLLQCERLGVGDSWAFFQRLNRRMAQHGMSAGAYYWDAGDGSRYFTDEDHFAGYRDGLAYPQLRELSADWYCRDEDGQLIAAGNDPVKRGFHADLTSDTAGRWGVQFGGDSFAG